MELTVSNRLKYVLDRKSKIPAIMGILNLTPDSFSDGGEYKDTASIRKKIDEMAEHDVDIIDIGGESTRPGAKPVDADTEWERIYFAIEYIKRNHPSLLISVDTYKSEIARKAIHSGAHIINDISGSTFDSGMLPVIAESDCAYVVMHTGGRPETMQQNPAFDDVVSEVYFFLESKSFECERLGISNIIIDPGIGFGKTAEHNRLLLQNLKHFTSLFYPVMVGISRKSMFNSLFDLPVKERDVPTAILHALLLNSGARIFRTHNTLLGKYLKTLSQYLDAG